MQLPVHPTIEFWRHHNSVLLTCLLTLDSLGFSVCEILEAQQTNRINNRMYFQAHIIGFWEMAQYPAWSHKSTPAVSPCAENILALHFIISNSVVNRQLLLLYIPLIATSRNFSWQSEVKYIPQCWHYSLFFVSYKWFVGMLWIWVRKCISRSFYEQPYILQLWRVSLLGNRKGHLALSHRPLRFSPFLSAHALQASLCREIHEAVVLCFSAHQPVNPSGNLSKLLTISFYGSDQTTCSIAILLPIQRLLSDHCQEQMKSGNHCFCNLQKVRNPVRGFILPWCWACDSSIISLSQ